MNLDRAVIAFAGVMILDQRRADPFRLALVAAVDRLRRPQPAAVQLHRLLPGGDGDAQARRQAGTRRGGAFK
jgi:hypothetical protein